MTKYNSQKFVIVWLLFGLLGCNDQLLKRADNEFDVIEVEHLADQAYENQDWLKSEQLYVKLVQKNRQNAIHWFRLGNIYARTQRADVALTAYREALALDPGLAKAWFNMGILQLKQSAKSFDNLQSSVDIQDPLYAKGLDIFTGIIELINNQSKSE